MTDSLSTEQAEHIIHFDSREQASLLALELVQQAKREIAYFGPNIDAVLFDHPDTIDCISAFARSSDKSQLRFLVHSTRENVAKGHRLIPLAQRLSSKFSIHNTAKQHQDLIQQFLLIDDQCYLYCQNSLYHSGRGSLQDPLEVMLLRQQFEEMWKLSTADSNTRRLQI
jgi:hypothetical protein